MFENSRLILFQCGNEQVNDMQQNPLGRSSIKVSEICLGTMTWGEQNTQDDAFEQIDYALDQGINFLDTAEMYAVPPKAQTQGATETIIGNWLAQNKRRDDIVLATKIAGRGLSWIRNGAPISASAIKKAIEGSLKRLQTDYIDLYQLHWPNRGSYHFRQIWNYNPYLQTKDKTIADMIEILETLDAMIREGKVRQIGLSNETAWGTKQYCDLAEQHDLPRMASIQNEYSLLCRYFDDDLAEVACYEDVGLLAWSPLATGLLSGKYQNGHIPKGCRGTFDNSLGGRMNSQSLAAVDAYLKIAQKHGLDPSQMAIAFCLKQPFMTSVIIGATTMEQLKTDIDAAKIDLTDQALADINEVFRRFPRAF